jgi:hypothetical protein
LPGAWERGGAAAGERVFAELTATSYFFTLHACDFWLTSLRDDFILLRLHDQGKVPLAGKAGTTESNRGTSGHILRIYTRIRKWVPCGRESVVWEDYGL